MALADTASAIEKVSDWIRSNVQTISGVDTFVGHPEPNGNTNPRLNLYLYEAHFDPHMKNLPLDEGQPPPLWLVLKYLLTSFDSDGKSSTTNAQSHLGLGLRALQQLAYLPESAHAALQPNPERLKITFDDTDAELLSKLMQGAEDKYHFSMGFQVRPVLIATGELPSYSLLVGVDYTATPPISVDEDKFEDAIGLQVIPAMMPVIKEIEPAKFEANQTIKIKGSYLDQSELVMHLGDQELAVNDQRADSLTCTIGGNIPNGTVISAGSHPIAVVKKLAGNRTRSSNLLVGHLRPTLNSATPDTPMTDVGGNVAGQIEMEGLLLGRQQDDIFVALYQNGATVKVFDDPFTYSADQKKLTLDIVNEEAVPSGAYLVILRVNGEQALKSIPVSLTT